MKNGTDPIIPIYFQDNQLAATGLTKREYFAGLAMQSVANPSIYPMSQENTDKATKEWAIRCVYLADELLKQLEE